MNKILFVSFVSIVLSGMLLSVNSNKAVGSYDRIDISEMPVEEALKNLDNAPYIHSMPRHDEAKAEIGEDLILYGRTEIDGKKSKRISKHFVCTDCHNLTREFEDGSSESSSDRLDYVSKKRIPFLPGSTFWGIYNRTSFYNGDYYKKYGEMVTNARDSLQNAVQLCAKYCSSGRYLEDWELEAIMHYYKKGELKVKDLEISENDLKNLLYSQKLKPDEKTRLTDVVHGSYRQSYSATFLSTMDVDKRKYGEGGDPIKGELIYDKSCLSCHANKRVTYLNLGKDQLSGGMFWRNRKNYRDKSLYQIIRYGTYSKVGRKQYMPLYTKEKMSDEQINDLMAYIKTLAKK